MLKFKDIQSALDAGVSIKQYSIREDLYHILTPDGIKLVKPEDIDIERVFRVQIGEIAVLPGVFTSDIE